MYFEIEISFLDTFLGWSCGGDGEGGGRGRIFTKLLKHFKLQNFQKQLKKKRAEKYLKD